MVHIMSKPKCMVVDIETAQEVYKCNRHFVISEDDVIEDDVIRKD